MQTVRAKDLQKVLEFVQDAFSEALDHMAGRFADTAEELGDDFAHVVDFAKSWTGLTKKNRKVFVEQLLKSAGLVTAGAVATRVGLSVALKQQKYLRMALLAVADFIQPVAKGVAKKGRKGKKKVKKALKKLKA